MNGWTDDLGGPRHCFWRVSHCPPGEWVSALGTELRSLVFHQRCMRTAGSPKHPVSSFYVTGRSGGQPKPDGPRPGSPELHSGHISIHVARVACVRGLRKARGPELPRAQEQTVDGPCAAGLFPRGTGTAPALILAQPRTPGDLGPQHIWEGGGRSFWRTQIQHARGASSAGIPATGLGLAGIAFPRAHSCCLPEPSGASGGEWHGGRVEQASCPQAGHRETAVQDSGRRACGSWDPGTRGATFSSGSWAWPRAGPAPVAWVLLCHVHRPAFLLEGQRRLDDDPSCFSRAPLALRDRPLQLPTRAWDPRWFLLCPGLVGTCASLHGVLSPLRGLP